MLLELELMLLELEWKILYPELTLLQLELITLQFQLVGFLHVLNNAKFCLTVRNSAFKHWLTVDYSFCGERHTWVVCTKLYAFYTKRYIP